MLLKQHGSWDHQLEWDSRAGRRCSSRKELDEKLPTNAPDLTSQPEGGMGHHPVGWAVGHTPPCSVAMAHMQEAKRISVAWRKNGLFLLNGKQTGVLIKILWSGCRQTKHGDLAPLHAGH